MKVGKEEYLEIRNAELEADNARLRKELKDADGLLEFERNRFQRQMQHKEAGIAEQLSRMLRLELQAIRETAEYVDEHNQYLLIRRLDRIENILSDFGKTE